MQTFLTNPQSTSLKQAYNRGYLIIGMCVLFLIGQEISLNSSSSLFIGQTLLANEHYKRVIILSSDIYGMVLDHFPLKGWNIYTNYSTVYCDLQSWQNNDFTVWWIDPCVNSIKFWLKKTLKIFPDLKYSNILDVVKGNDLILYQN